MRCPLLDDPASRRGRRLGHALTSSDVHPLIYPNDAIENLVLAHERCNNDKRDHLASAKHVARWSDRLSTRAVELARIADDATWNSAPERSLGVARSIYLRLGSAHSGPHV